MAVLRNELKFYLHSADAHLLENRLAFAIKRDRHSSEIFSYLVQSLYFDDPALTAFYEKLDGIENRSKYRIRFYNDDLSYIRLEKKEKFRNLCRKTSERITLDVAQAFVDGQPVFQNFADGLKGEFSHLIFHERYRPMVYLSYQRKAFVYPTGNVRVTLDSTLKASRFSGDLTRPCVTSVPVMDATETILEIKFNQFLPHFISELFEDIPKQISAISKFCKGVEALY